MVDDFLKRGSESKEVVRLIPRFPVKDMLSATPWVGASSCLLSCVSLEDKSRALMEWLEFVIGNVYLIVFDATTALMVKSTEDY